MTAPAEPESSPPRGVRFRRSANLFAYWTRSGLTVRNFLTGSESVLSQQATEILGELAQWRSPDDLARDRGADVGSTWATLSELLRCDAIEAFNVPPDDAEVAMRDWRFWCPEAAIFHFGTKDVVYSQERPSRGGVVDYPVELPAATKSYPDADKVQLPPYSQTGELAETLLARRTWRRFGPEPITKQDLATLLGLTWGVQHWADFGPARSPLKTSPSGGARHSIEAYVVALRVDGLEPGTYYYDPDGHQLAALSAGASGDLVDEFLPQIPSYRGAAALVFMTSLFERVWWRYRFPRAYRTILLEAGHLCQTMCLVATRLGLAPFCTAAIADSKVERHLGVDGVGESVIYLAGVGARPPDESEWAPAANPDATPAVHPPKHARRKSP
ncbi:MAG: SagB/ThcOx family dehydrogenase [Acidobacteria bacterium]|nr:SagB/ThcOx family dehydrogenase [Acidobacteriota bacterium]